MDDCPGEQRLRLLSAGTNKQPTRRDDLTGIAQPTLGRNPIRFVWQRWLAGLLLAVSCLLVTAPLASAQTRTLKLYYLHTREKAEITYMKNGKYVQSGLNQLNHFLRDWRRNEPTKMDPRLFDLVWEVYRATGARDHIHVVSAYRSPATNTMLRKRSRGVAEKSQHTLGRAMDFFIPGVKLKDLRYAGLRVQGGGVGYYPTSGSPFIHLDVGNVRHWPKMSRSELAAVFPKGNTLHVPTDGKPLPGYEQAVAAYQQRKGAGIAIASATSAPTKRSGGFLAALFGGGGVDEEEESGGMNAVPAARPSVQVAEATPVKPKIVEAPFPDASPAPSASQPAESVEAIVAALPLRDVPAPMFAPRPPAEVGPTVAMAAAVPAPGNIPFEVRNEDPAPVELAENVPIPMRRPDYAPTVEVAEASATASAIAPVPAPPAGELAIETVLAQNDGSQQETAGIPTPVFRPEPPVVLASLGATDGSVDPVADAAEPGESYTPKTDRVALAGQRPASPRDALRGQEGADAMAMLNTGVNTTPKAAKPSRADSRPEPKPVSVPVESGQVGKVIVDGSKIALSPKPNGTAFAFSSLRSAPTEVYTAGFQQTAALAPDPHRFTGKAVEFLSVAKFKTN